MNKASPTCFVYPMSSRSQIQFFTAILLGAALPLAALALNAKVQQDYYLVGMIAALVIAGGVSLSNLWANKAEQERQAERDTLTAQTREPLEKKLFQQRELLSTKASRLTALSNDHQHRATTSTSSAAQATENATIIASAIEEMNSAITEIGRQADEASTIASGAAEKAQKADVSASSLSEKSDQILSIVELIRTIAERTNLLALNATIEAARAGEHGKGFAVVASEVKNLAKQTADATTRIETQINEVREASHGMKDQMRAIEETVGSITTITKTIKNALQEETAAAHEIARSAVETTRATKAVTDGLSHMLVTTEEIRSAAAGLQEDLVKLS